MHTQLSKGQVLIARGMHAACVVHDLLGEGGQAEVYRARVGPQEYALKWYFPHYMHADPRLWERLRRAIDSGSPNDKFLWPFDVVSHPRTDALSGYLMPLKPAGFISLVDLLRRAVEPSFRALAHVGFHLSDSFFRLHACGLCYRDINFGNIFFQPDSGDIRIGDTDNVDVNRRPGGIMGTWGFMAPEVGRREAEPSAMTDRYSLAVLLFYVFMLGHPLRGKRENEMSYDPSDPDGSRRLCSDAPLFVFDPQNDSNRPVRGIHDVLLNFWPIYPDSLRDLFTRSFTAGLRDPDQRVMENEWRNEMVALADSVFPCPACNAENFLDLSRLRKRLALSPCWCCQKPLPMPPRMRVTSTHEPCVVILNPGVQLFAHHLESDRYNFTTPLAQVTANPLGIRNLSGRSWTTRAGSGTSLIETRPGETLILRENCRVNFGRSEGEIKI